MSSHRQDICQNTLQPGFLASDASNRKRRMFISIAWLEAACAVFVGAVVSSSKAVGVQGDVSELVSPTYPIWEIFFGFSKRGRASPWLHHQHRAMAAPFPYTHYACPCSSNTPDSNASDAVESAPFNPHSRSAQYSLFPLDHLLYCDECETPRCPRCVTEDVLSWYCPNCLFEVPSSSVRSEGNRNCFECPVCEAPVNITAIPAISVGQTVSNDYLKPSDAPRPKDRDRDEETAAQEYILHCGYCNWSTIDVGARLSKSVKIGDQLSKIRRTRLQPGRSSRSPERTTTGIEDEGNNQPQGAGTCLSHDDAYSNLTSFYKTQMSEAQGENGDLYASTNSPYSSPANLARIMSLYSTTSSFQAMKKTREKPQPFAEARSRDEGMSAYYPRSTAVGNESLHSANDDQDIISTLSTFGLDHTTTYQQRLSAPGTNFTARFVSDLWPIATKLRTKRGKRCRTCRQYLSRPDPKLNNLRYKIRLLASNHLPLLTTKPLHPTSPAMIGSAAFRLREEDVAAGSHATLVPGRALQYVLTIRNSIFEPIKVTLATPQTTPGTVSSRVTILCPSFTVGPAGDVWEEALGSSTTTIAPSTGTDGSRRAALASLSADEKVPEAGKIWEKTRNTTSVVMEIVPGELPPPPPPSSDAHEKDGGGAVDEEVLELPIFVHVEWTAHHQNDPHANGEKRSERERRAAASADVGAAGPGESERKELGDKGEHGSCEDECQRNAASLHPSLASAPTCSGERHFSSTLGRCKRGTTLAGRRASLADLLASEGIPYECDCWHGLPTLSDRACAPAYSLARVAVSREPRHAEPMRDILSDDLADWLDADCSCDAWCSDGDWGRTAEECGT
nr:isoform 2 of dynactin subunit 4 [Quercus suber]